MANIIMFGGCLHTTLVVLNTLKEIQRLLPQTTVNATPIETTIMVNAWVDAETAAVVLEQMDAIEPYMRGWWRIYVGESLHHYGPEKPI